MPEIIRVDAEREEAMPEQTPTAGAVSGHDPRGEKGAPLSGGSPLSKGDAPYVRPYDSRGTDRPSGIIQDNERFPARVQDGGMAENGDGEQDWRTPVIGGNAEGPEDTFLKGYGDHRAVQFRGGVRKWQEFAGNPGGPSVELGTNTALRKDTGRNPGSKGF